MIKRVAVIILNWNGSELLRKFLPSVVANTPDWADIIVADNGSTDDSLDLIRSSFPSVKIMPLSKNHGFAEGYNIAINSVEHEYCVLLNSDVEVTPNWLDAPIELLDSNKEVACIQPKIRSERDKDFFEYAGAAGGFIDKYGYPFCRGRIMHIVEKDNGQYDNETEILWATGACLFVRTNLYKEVGGLDAGFFAHQEEVDMCWRLRSRGYQLLYTHRSTVYHVGGATLNAENPRKTFLNFRNSLLMLYKNSSEADLKHVMRVRFILDYVAAAKFLIDGHIANAKAVYKARREFQRLIPEYKAKRIDNLNKRRLNNIPELLSHSLIWQFYFKGKHTFDKLSDLL